MCVYASTNTIQHCTFVHIHCTIVHLQFSIQADGALETDLTYKVIEDSGTTVATVLLKGDLFLAAGLGDSRVVLGLCSVVVLGLLLRGTRSV